MSFSAGSSFVAGVLFRALSLCGLVRLLCCSANLQGKQGSEEPTEVLLGRDHGHAWAACSLVIRRGSSRPPSWDAVFASVEGDGDSSLVLELRPSF